MDSVNHTGSKKVFCAHEGADRQEGFDSRRPRQVKSLSASLTVFDKGIELPANNKHHNKECYLYRPAQLLGIKAVPFIFTRLPGIRSFFLKIKPLHWCRHWLLLFNLFQVTNLPTLFEFRICQKNKHSIAIQYRVTLFGFRYVATLKHLIHNNLKFRMLYSLLKQLFYL